MTVPHLRKIRAWAAPALSLALAASAGCESAPPGAGFTNPNAGSMADRDKAAVRTDLPVPDENAGRDATLAEAVSSGPGGTAETGTTGAGTAPTPAGPKQSSPGAATPPTGSPPTKPNSGTAQGATKAPDTIQTGTPRSPR